MFQRNRSRSRSSVTSTLAQRAINILTSSGPGAWYDPSDLTTLFQDSAGTTPVTAVEQPVGKILDKSGGGNHLIQPTATSRPTLSSLYNLLTKTEQFDDAAWIKTTGTTVTANSATAPDGTLTADTVAYNGTGASGSYRIYSGMTLISIPGAGYTAKVWLRADAPVTIAISGNTVAGVVTSVNVTTDWQQFTISGTGDGVAGVQLLIYSPAGNNAAFQVYAWGASLTNASDAALPYQRVNTATDYDYDFSKFPAYLKFDGVDDSMYTAASVDFTSTDKMTVWAGVHKASDADAGILVESSSAPNSTAGTFTAQAPVGPGLASFGIWNAGTIQRGAEVSGATYAAPSTRVLTGVGDISGDLVALRLNGAQVASAATDQGTGNYGNHVLYVGRRNNASFPFSGRIYQLALKGKAMTAAEISTLESYINSKTKAY